MKYKTNQSYKGKLNKGQKKQVKSMIKSEFDAEVKTAIFEDLQSITSTPYIVDITGGLAKGLNSYERVGDQITIKELIISFEVVTDQSLVFTTDTYNHVRVIFFRYYDAGGPPALPPAGEILSTTGIVTAVFRQQNYEKQDAGSVHIIYDKTFELFNTPVYTGSAVANYPGVNCTDGVMNKHFKLNKLGKHNVYWDQGLTIGNGHIYALVVSDSTVSPHPVFEFSSSLKYTDS